MIKTYLQFINESNNIPPGPGIENVISISISDSEMNYITDPIISSMISQGEISVIDNQLYYEGQFYSGVYEGIGKIFYPNGQIKYHGEFANLNKID